MEVDFLERWYDERLKFFSPASDTIRLSNSDKVWSPDTHFVKGIPTLSRGEDASFKNDQIIIHNNGTLMRTSR